MKEGMNDDLAIRSLSLTIIPDPPEGTMLTIFTLSVYNIYNYHNARGKLFKNFYLFQSDKI